MSTPVITNLPATVFPMKRIAAALDILRAAGIPIPQATVAEKPMTQLMNEMATLDEPKVVAITRTLGQAEVFNEVVRDQLQAVEIGDAYTVIATRFDSIRDDAKVMVEQLSDGRLNALEKLRNLWVRVSRGSIPDRFSSIKSSAEDLFARTQDQLARERVILDAYREFRSSIKESSILAEDLIVVAKAQLDAAQSALAQAQGQVERAEAGRPRAEAELARDQALSHLQSTDRRYQVTLDLANNLTISYNTGEVVMARLVQASEAKNRVWRQSVTFFATNESVLTALSATFTATQGLHEATAGHKALKEGVNRSLEALADLGGQVIEDATREGYGPTTSATSLKKLIDSVVGFQERVQSISQEMRTAAATNRQEIETAVEDGKRRLLALAANSGAQLDVQVPSAAPDEVNALPASR